jgi:8-oxo-dGTP pyrophosphatase MutT (NUDIX family)
MNTIATNDPYIQHLSQRLAGPLPGQEAQYQMASMRRLNELSQYRIPDNARVACVLNLLHFSDGAWRTVLIRRTENPHDRHSGQISFPGGRYEPEQDPSLEAVALRETEEEIGIPGARIRLLGRMTELYIPVSNFLVHPFIGVLEGAPEFRLQPGEVEAVLTPSLEHLAHPETKKVTDIRLGGGLTIPEVPYFEVEGRIVWGATAMILSEFLALHDF